MPSFGRLAVFCGSSNAPPEAYFTAARQFGALLARSGIGVVYGGGRVGLMNALADGALAAGGEVIGVIPTALLNHELGRADLSRLEVVPDMHARKARMAELSDGFVALPGGYGTLEELFEALTWTQLHLHDKPVGLLEIDGFYAGLLAWIARAAQDGFVRPLHADLLVVDGDPARLLTRMADQHRPSVSDWIRDP